MLSQSWRYVCSVCNGTVGKKEASIVCKSCRNWIHLKECANLSVKEAKKVQQDFACSACVAAGMILASDDEDEVQEVGKEVKKEKEQRTLNSIG